MALTLRDVGISFVIFASVITGGLSFIGGFTNQYDVDYKNDTLASVSSTVSSEANSLASQAGNRSQDFDEGRSLLDIGGFFINRVYQVAVLPLTALSAIEIMASDMLTVLPIGNPEWFITLIFGVFTVIVSYEILSLYRGLRT